MKIPLDALKDTKERLEKDREAIGDILGVEMLESHIETLTTLIQEYERKQIWD